MRADRLFSILGLVDPDLVEEALEDTEHPRRAGIWRRYAAAAACCAVICGALLWGGSLWMGATGSDSASSVAEDTAGAGSPADGASGGANGSESAGFLSYAGPVLPLTTAEPHPGLTAERTLIWDLAPGTYEDGTPRQWGARVTDTYLLTNPTRENVTVTALYPVTGSLADLSGISPALTVDGTAPNCTLYAGPYAGSFQDAGEDDGSTWNLAEPSAWEDYAALVSDEAYQAQALGEGPDLSVPVTVYRFSDFEAPHEQYDAATQAVEFTADPSATTVLSCGFNGLSQDSESGWRRYDYFVPDGVRGESDLKMLVVLGEDIGSYTLQGYADGACEDPIDGVRCTVTREETTLEAVVAELCRAVLDRHQGSSWDFSSLPLSVYEKAAAELLAEYGLLSDVPMDRYTDGRLDDLLWDVLVQPRILYLAVPVTVPAGGSVEVSASFWKEPSYDFGGSGTGREDLQGFDLLTTAGSALTFTEQLVAAIHTDSAALEFQDMGLDWGGNSTAEVSLDPNQPRYTFEIRPLA